MLSDDAIEAMIELLMAAERLWRLPAALEVIAFLELKYLS